MNNAKKELGDVNAVLNERKFQLSYWEDTIKKRTIIEENQRLLIERLRMVITSAQNVEPEPEAPKPSYKHAKGDMIDEMMAQYMNGCAVPMTRLGDGFYLFGTKKIYAKIMNGKLVVRVGGGYMIIEEFLQQYTDQELAKIKSYMAKEEVDVYEDLKVYKKFVLLEGTPNAHLSQRFSKISTKKN